MFKKNPDLIDKYIILFICSIFMCLCILCSIFWTVIFGSYSLVGYVDVCYDLLTIIDFIVLVVLSIIWYLSIALMGYSMCILGRAYRSFMES